MVVGDFCAVGEHLEQKRQLLRWFGLGLSEGELGPCFDANEQTLDSGELVRRVLA
jgi:hypothetical protein